MKPRPENWKELGSERQMRHLMGQATGVCWCNPSLDESCKDCKNLADIEEKDRNYLEEAIIIAKEMMKESPSKDDEYWMYKNLLEIDEPDSFNNNIRHYFIEENNSFDDGYAYFHKSMRQCDYYTHIIMRREKPDADGETHVSTGILDNMLHTFLNISNAPYNVIKRLMSI